MNQNYLQRQVTAIDGDEAVDSIAVTIHVLDLNEGPKIRSTYLDTLSMPSRSPDTMPGRGSPPR